MVWRSYGDDLRHPLDHDKPAESYPWCNELDMRPLPGVVVTCLVTGSGIAVFRDEKAGRRAAGCLERKY